MYRKERTLRTTLHDKIIEAPEDLWGDRNVSISINSGQFGINQLLCVCILIAARHVNPRHKITNVASGQLENNHRQVDGMDGAIPPNVNGGGLAI